MVDETPHYVEQLEQKIAILTQIVEISTHLNSTLPVDQLLGQIMDAAANITDCESASVLLWNQKTRELYFAATTTDSPLNLIGKPVPLEGSIAGTIMREHRLVEVNNARLDSRVYTAIEEDATNPNVFRTRSLLGVPMTVKNRMIGVLEVVNKRELPWTNDDREHLQVIASQAAVAIEGAQMVQALKRANDELNQLDKLKNDFIAIASHELRTPLGVILGYASFLQDEMRDDETNRDHIEKVMNSALKLRKIIEDLTNLRYLEQNSADLQMMLVSVDQLVRDAQFDVMTLLDSTGQKLIVHDIDPAMTVEIDRARMAMAITNILVNAIEFTPREKTITINTIRRSGEVWIQIVDEGIGIEEGELDRIFEKFYQTENHLIRFHQGLGIGLSISQALIEAHHGRIWAESAGKDQGSTFTVSLPLVGG